MTLKPTNQARNLGVVLDSDLNFNSHIKTITKSAYYHLKNIARIKGFLSEEDTEKLVVNQWKPAPHLLSDHQSSRAPCCTECCFPAKLIQLLNINWGEKRSKTRA